MAALKYPKLEATLTSNSFVGTMPEDITGGVFNAASLT
jgi:hypothetical protein